MSRRRGGVSSLTVLLHLILHVTIVQSDDDISQVQHSDDWPQWLPPCALACFSLALFFLSVPHICMLAPIPAS